jgi:hypothetical protein
VGLERDPVETAGGIKGGGEAERESYGVRTVCLVKNPHAYDTKGRGGGMTRAKLELLFGARALNCKRCVAWVAGESLKPNQREW